MSDESSRSARPYGQRRNDGAPIWWAALDRTDLPDTEVEPSTQRRWYEEAEPVANRAEVASQARPARGHRGWLIGLLVALSIAAVLGVAQIVDSLTGDGGQVVFVTLLTGIPVGLAVAVTIFVARRNS